MYWYFLYLCSMKEDIKRVNSSEKTQVKHTDFSGGKDTLETQIEHLLSEKASLAAKISSLEEKNISLEEKNTSLEEKNAKLRQELLYYQRRMFGRCSEKRMPQHPEGALFIPFGEETIPEETADILPIVEEIKIASHKRKIQIQKRAKKDKPKREEIPTDIERRIHIIEPENVDHENMVKIGEDVREVLQYIPGTFYVDRFIRPIYKDKVQDKEALKTIIYQAEPIETFIPKSIAGNTLLTQLIVSKYTDHLPIYRQLEIFKRQGMKLAPSTICGWMQEVATQLQPLYEQLVSNILSSNYIQVDETTMPVVDHVKKQAVKEYMWAIHDVMNKQVFFHYDEGSRAQKVVISLLKNYQGAVQTDGYEAYSIYEDKQGVILLGCWAHARRKFENALTEDEARANKALDYISLLYQVEANLKEGNLSNEEIAQERKRLSYPVLLEFEKWMHDISADLLPKSLMGKAVSYTFSLYHRLVRYVSDGKWHIDNNAIENAIRPVALGRKNYLFCGNHDTAKDAALFYSLLESCKLAEVNPAEWLSDILSRLKDCKSSELNTLLPANWKP